MTAANAERNGAELETLRVFVGRARPAAGAGAVGPRARLRRALRAPQRGRAARAPAAPRGPRCGWPTRPRARGALPRGGTERLDDDDEAGAGARQRRGAPAAEASPGVISRLPRTARGCSGRRGGGGGADRAVEQHRVSLVQRVNGAVEVDLEARRGSRRRRPRRWSSQPPRPRLGVARPLPHPQRGAAGQDLADAAAGPRACARRSRAPSGGRVHNELTGTSSACAMRSTDATLGRARPRSSWLRNGCDRPASRPRAFSVSPRTRRNSRTRAPRRAERPGTVGCRVAPLPKYRKKRVAGWRRGCRRTANRGESGGDPRRVVRRTRSRTGRRRVVRRESGP